MWNSHERLPNVCQGGRLREQGSYLRSAAKGHGLLEPTGSEYLMGRVEG